MTQPRNQANYELKMTIEKTTGTINIPAGTEIKGLTSLAVTVDNEVQEWTAFDNKGFTSNLITSKKVAIAFELTYDAADATHQTLQKLFLASEVREQNGFTIKMEFPKSAETITTASTYELFGNLEAGDVVGGDAEEVGKMTFNLHVSGVPKFTEEVA